MGSESRTVHSFVAREAETVAGTRQVGSYTYADENGVLMEVRCNSDPGSAIVLFFFSSPAPERLEQRNGIGQMQNGLGYSSHL